MSRTSPQENVLFLHSEMKDPYSFYNRMRSGSPVYYDKKNKLWAVYSYEGCRAVLENSAAWIPRNPTLLYLLSDESASIVLNLARLRNPPQHSEAREAATSLLTKWRSPDTVQAMQYLLGEPRLPATLDWVTCIGKRLPAFLLLKGFGFSAGEIDAILPRIDDLVPILAANRSPGQAAALNRAIEEITGPVHACVSRNITGRRSPSEVQLYTANFIGLLIQSHDAGRGLLSHALLHAINKTAPTPTADVARSLVIESLRFDPPVHNTRRVLKADLILHGHRVPRGAEILVVVASANRDPLRFSDPDTFNTHRPGPVYYLSYGAGAHQCIAEHFSIGLTTSALHYMFTKYSTLQIQESCLQYEPKTNVRLPAKISLMLS